MDTLLLDSACAVNRKDTALLYALHAAHEWLSCRGGQGFWADSCGKPGRLIFQFFSLTIPLPSPILRSLFP